MRELLKQFLSFLFQLWTAPADQAVQLMGTLVEQVIYLFVLYVFLKWLWRRMFK